MTWCEFYPLPEDDTHGGVCYANSELGRVPCTTEDQQLCPYAKEAKELDNYVTNPKP